MSFSTYREKNNLISFSDYKELFNGYSSYRIINSSMLSDIEDLNLRTKDNFENSLYNILTNSSKIKNTDTLNINALSLDYLLFKDREIIESSPHLFIDGALSVAKIMSLNNINIYINKYFRDVYKILTLALSDATEAGYLNNINISIIDDSKIGYYELNKLDNLLDVESIISIAQLAKMGYVNFKKYREKNILMSITGDVKNIDLYDFETQKSINDIIKTKNNEAIKCVFTGGFINRVLSKSDTLDIKLNYESFSQNNLRIGNGVICVIGESTCIIRTLFKIVLFCVSVSCDKCIPCRSGFVAVENYLKDILTGHGNNKDYYIMKKILSSISVGAICPELKLFSSSILSAIEMFEDEFIYAIEYKKTMYSFYSNESYTL